MFKFGYALIALCIGCASPRSTTPAACPRPAPSAREALPFIDTLPVLRDDGMSCVVWQRNEGDGRVVRLIKKINGKTFIKVLQLDDEGYQTLLAIITRLSKETPQFASRTLWTLCSTDEGEMM